MLSEEAGEIGVSESVFIEMLVKKYVKRNNKKRGEALSFYVQKRKNTY